jgi:hypothetical protein
MSDEQAPEGDQPRDPRARPAFLPPVDGHPPPPAYQAVYPAPRDPAAQGVLWNIGVIIAGAVLLVSAFLPWAEARITIDLFGRVLSRDLGTVAGLEADNVVVAVPVLAMIAVAMAFWGIIGRDTRVSALAALPGALSLLVCALFVLRLDEIKNRLASDELSVGYQIAVVTGWYLAVAMSLLVIGFSVARPILRRVASRSPGGATAVPAEAAVAGADRPAQWPQEHGPQPHEQAPHPQEQGPHPQEQGPHPQEQPPPTAPKPSGTDQS